LMQCLDKTKFTFENGLVFFASDGNGLPPFPVPGVMKGLVRKQVVVQVVRCADSA
jgi:hypothetical protein